LHGDRAQLRARWLGAARLVEHRIPAALPAAFAPGTRSIPAWTAFEPPEEGARSAAELRETLADRRLALLHPELARSGGGVYLLPPREPEDFAEP